MTEHRVDWRVMMPRPQPQQRATSGGLVTKETVKGGMKHVEVTEIEIDLTMKRESMTPSPEILTTEAGASWPLLDLKNIQQHKPPLIILMWGWETNKLLPDLTIPTFWGIPVEVDMHLKLLARDMAPTPHPECKSSTAHHLTGILHLVLIKIEQAAWLHNHSRLLLLLQEI